MYTIPHAETHVYKPLPTDKAVSIYVYNTSCRNTMFISFYQTTKLFLFMYTIPHAETHIYKLYQKTKLFLFMYIIPHAETHVHMPLPNDKFLDVMILRAFADDKSNVT